MSLRRAVAKLPLQTCLKAASVVSSRMVSNQSNFEGVFEAYFWDHETGFGQSQNGSLVLVSQSENSSSQLNSSEGHFWEALLHPSPALDHNLLRDELQMDVLSYDDDSVHLEATSLNPMKLPIYKSTLSKLSDFTPSTDPFITGGTTSQPENRSGGGSESPRQACA